MLCGGTIALSSVVALPESFPIVSWRQLAQEAVVAVSFLAYQSALHRGYSTASCARRTTSNAQ